MPNVLSGSNLTLGDFRRMVADLPDLTPLALQGVAIGITRISPMAEPGPDETIIMLDPTDAIRRLLLATAAELEYSV